jgi:hypothetical protein
MPLSDVEQKFQIVCIGRARIATPETVRPPRGGLSEIRSGVLIRRLLELSASCASQAGQYAEAGGEER